MRVNMRNERRAVSRKSYTVTWEDDARITQTTPVRGIDSSHSGIGFFSPVPLLFGTTVYIQGENASPMGYGEVRHSTPKGSGYIVGVLLNEDARKDVSQRDDRTNYYEFLQISPNAEMPTIHRIYRFLAARFHPDNPETGDVEKFVLLNRAFEVLSDAQRRAEYDAGLQNENGDANPVFTSVDFMDGIEGEVNRRLAVLSVLYNRRRTNSDTPAVSLAELEARMGFPREYLDFTTWYLRNKKYITRADNSDFELTAAGADFVEANYPSVPMLQRFLNQGNHSSSRPSEPTPPDKRKRSLLKSGDAQESDGGGS